LKAFISLTFYVTLLNLLKERRTESEVVKVISARYLHPEAQLRLRYDQVV
jgi:hypothetical protein